MEFGIPKLNVPASKLEKLANDIAALEVSAVMKVGKSAANVPTFQRQGYLEKLGHARMKWFKRFFVLRDSFLLSYNLQKSDFTVEPRAAIHLGNSNIQIMEHQGKDFCFLITTIQKDRFLFAAASEDERQQWVGDLDTSRSVTHANMIKLAVENQMLAEEKGAAGVVKGDSTTALAIFSNEEYIRNTPITGGAEGWLKTAGFNPEEQKKKKEGVEKKYFILRDSHLLMFNSGDILTKPRGVMYLIGTDVIVEDDKEGDTFDFSVKSDQCGDIITLGAPSLKVRNRWVTALKIGGRCSYPDFQVLIKQHALISAVAMTPRAAPPSAPNQPSGALEVPPPPALFETFDLTGQQLDPAVQQAYDGEGLPILRTPDGIQLSAGGDEVVASTPRFNASGQQLDPFNRPLPPGAVPMFTSDGAAIGVGPDAKHYLLDGSEVASSDKHFDADGNELAPTIIKAADAVAVDINVAIKVREKLKGDNTNPEAVDALGRTFRASNEDNGMLLNADGVEVPLASARGVAKGTGLLVAYEAPKQAAGKSTIMVQMEYQGETKNLGEVEIGTNTTVADVRRMIVSEMDDVGPFVFLQNYIELLKYEERDKLAASFDGEIMIRGKELAPVKAKFTKKTSKMAVYEKEKEAEKSEFDDIFARVRQGKFLRSVKGAEE